MKLPIVHLVRDQLPIPTLVLATIRFMEGRCPACGSEEDWSDATWCCEASDKLTTDSEIPVGCGFAASEELTNRIEASDPDPDGDSLQRALEVQHLCEEAIVHFRALCVQFGRCPSCGNMEFTTGQTCGVCGFAYTEDLASILNGKIGDPITESSFPEQVNAWYRQGAQEGATYAAVPREG